MSWLEILFAFMAGILMGFIYFGGLLVTVRALVGARQPALITLGSFLVRMLITLVGFYFVMGGRFDNLLACLVGFLLARQAMFKAVGDGKTGEALP